MFGYSFTVSARACIALQLRTYIVRGAGEGCVAVAARLFRQSANVLIVW